MADDRDIDNDQDLDMVLNDLDKDLEDDLSSERESLGDNSLYQLKKSLQAMQNSASQANQGEPSLSEGSSTNRLL